MRYKKKLLSRLILIATTSVFLLEILTITSYANEIQQKLQRKVTIELSNAILRDALTELGRLSDITIIFKISNEEQCQKIAKLKFTNIPMEDALWALLRPRGLFYEIEYQIEEDYILICKGKRQVQVQLLFITAPVSVLKELDIPDILTKMPDRETLLIACAKRNDIKLFSYPVITVFDGVKGSANDIQPVQYMDFDRQENGSGGMGRLENGTLVPKLKTCEEQVGTIFEITANVERDYITIKGKLEISRLKGRLAPINKEVPEELGWPVIDRFSQAIEVMLKNDDVVLLDGGSEERIEKTTDQTTVEYSKTITLLTAHILRHSELVDSRVYRSQGYGAKMHKHEN